MKHPIRFFAVLFLVITAVAAAILMTIRYMDVLQRQFDFLRSLIARKNGTPRKGVDEGADDGVEDEGEDFATGDYTSDSLPF